MALSCANDSCRHPQLLTGSVVQARSCPLGAAASRVGGVVVDFADVHDDADPQLPVRAVAGGMSALYSASSLPRVGTGFESVLAEWPTLAGSRYSGVRWCPRSSSSRSLAPGPRWLWGARSLPSASFPLSLILVTFAQVSARVRGGWLYYLTSLTWLAHSGRGRRSRRGAAGSRSSR